MSSHEHALDFSGTNVMKIIWMKKEKDDFMFFSPHQHCLRCWLVAKDHGMLNLFGANISI